MNFQTSTYMAPSGAFLSARGFMQGDRAEGEYDVVYNPGVIEKYRNSFQIKPAFRFESPEWFESLSKYQCRVQESDFDCFAEKLTSLTNNLQGFQPDCSLGPLRGAAKPCVLTEVMSKGEIQFDFFNYQRGSDPVNRPRVMNDLKAILKDRDPGSEIFNINVTDTAKGGNGINALVSILKEIKEGAASYKKQTWNLDLNLLHTAEADVGNIYKVLELGNPGSFKINLNRYDIPNLIFEDYDPALAVELFTDHGRYLFKPCAEPGKMLLRKDDDVFFVETDNTTLMLEEFFSKSATEHFLTSLDRNSSKDVWPDYQNKQ